MECLALVRVGKTPCSSLSPTVSLKRLSTFHYNQNLELCAERFNRGLAADVRKVSLRGLSRINVVLIIEAPLVVTTRT